MYPPHSQGGYELVWRSAVEYLRRRGHRVRVLTTDYRIPGLRAESEDEDVHRELRWYWRDHRFPRRRLAASFALERHNAAVLDRHLEDLSPDVVVWWSMGGMSLSLVGRVSRARIAAAGVVADDWMLYGPQVDGWCRTFAGRPRLGTLVERVTGIPTRFEPPAGTPWVFVSDAVRQTSLLPGHRLADTQVAHHGIDPTLFPQASERSWSWRLVYAGRIDPRKGIDTAVRALPLLPAEATLRVLGRGDDAHLEELRALVRELGLDARVEFGHLPRERLHTAYAEADVVLFPVRWEEPWGLVPIEAMSVGRPVVATGSGGSSEYLRHEENCLVFRPVDDAGELAAAVSRLAEDEALRRRLREAGFATAARFGEERFHHVLEAALERAAA
jgi:glycosyltransferase involved in cell wall biosynthesis